MTDYSPGIRLSDVERETILEALKTFKGNRRLAAASLDISLRALQYKLSGYLDQGFDVPPPSVIPTKE